MNNEGKKTECGCGCQASTEQTKKCNNPNCKCENCDCCKCENCNCENCNCCTC